MVTGFKVAQRVQLHPDVARRMIGDRFGKVVKLGRSLIHVKMDKSGHTITVHPEKLLPVEPAVPPARRR